MIAPTTPYLYLDLTFMHVNIRQLLILLDFTIRFYRAPAFKSETVGNGIFTNRSWREAILNSTHPIYYQRSQFFETINWFQNIFHTAAKFSALLVSRESMCQYKSSQIYAYFCKYKILLNVHQKYILRLPSSQPLYMRGKVTFRKCNKCQVCLYPSWTSNERPSFASTFSVGHPKAHRRASIQTNYHSSLFLFVRCEKKIEPCGAFQSRLKGINFYFVCLWESGKCDLVKALTAPSR